ncbi:MAG: RidA family protein [Defluviitaleaceae bacterium]|nr:RidA family protein [Defluviitaleaceae bacterium]
MRDITRTNISEEMALAGIVEAGGFVFISFCVGNVGQPIEAQINGAFDHLNERLQSIGLTLESVVKIDAMFRDIWNIPVLEKVIKERFHSKYPARKSIQTEFAHIGGQNGLLFQLDAIAFKGCS